MLRDHRDQNPLGLRVASWKEEITSEIKNLLVESQKVMLKLLKPETRENQREKTEEETENETRSFYTPTKSVRINSTQSTQNNDPCSSLNTLQHPPGPMKSEHKTLELKKRFFGKQFTRSFDIHDT